MTPIRTTFSTTLYRDGSICFIPVPFDPRPLFGKVRAPVQVTLNGYTFASTIAQMGAGPCIPLRKSNREAAQLAGTETLDVTLVLDTQARTVTPPDDLVAALRRAGVLAAWQALSYSHQREHVEAIEGAKAADTRARRIAKAIEMVGAKARTSVKATRAKASAPSRAKASATSRPTATPRASASATSRPTATPRAKASTTASTTPRARSSRPR